MEATAKKTSVDFHPHQPTIAGIVDDLNVLIDRVVQLFDDNKSLRIKYFQQVWHEMKFGLIFHGRPFYRELHELTEDIFDLVRNKTLSKEALGNRAAALYLLYALYCKQPCRPMVRIRVSMDQYKDLSEWMKQCRRDRHWELVYVWSQLVLDHAFLFVGSTKPVGMENATMAEKRASVAGQFYLTGGRDDSGHVPIGKNEEFKDMVERVRRAHSRYVAMKSALVGDASQDQGLAQINPDLPENIMEVASVHHRSAGRPGHRESMGNLLEEDGVTIGQRRKRLMQKAFSHHTNHKRHSHEFVEVAADELTEEEEGDEFYDEDFSKLLGKKKSRKTTGRGRGRPQADKSAKIGKRKRKTSARSPGSGGKSDLDKSLEEVIKSCGAYRDDPSLLQKRECPSTSRLFAVASKIARQEGRAPDVPESDDNVISF